MGDGLGVQWELPGAVARRDQIHALGFFLGAHTSTRPEAVCRASVVPMDLPFRVDYLDAEWLLPVLVRKAA